VACSLWVLVAIQLTFLDLCFAFAGARQIQVATRHVEDDQHLVCDCQLVLDDQECAEEESSSWVTVRKTSWVAMVQHNRYHHPVADHVIVLAIALVPEDLEQHIQYRSSVEELENPKLEAVVGGQVVREEQKRCAGSEDAHLCQKLL
jgi:hypothetical protein